MLANCIGWLLLTAVAAAVVWGTAALVAWSGHQSIDRVLPYVLVGVIAGNWASTITRRPF